jgi:hypothetical protein
VLPKGAVENRIDRALARRCARSPNDPICNPPDVIVPQDVVVPTEVHTANHRPPQRLDAGGIALRIAGTWREVDWDLYHYTGPETGPDAQLDAQFVSRHDPFHSGTTDVNLLHTVDLQLRARATLRQDLATIHMTGADCSAVLGGATVRAEAAVFDDRPYLRATRDLLSDTLAAVPIDRFVDRALREGCSPRRPCRGRVRPGDLFPQLDSVEWGVGGDYVVHGVVPLVQVNQIVFLEPVPRLVVDDPETRVTVLARRRFLADRLELEARGLYAVERQSWIAFPRASYWITDDLRLRLGYLAVGGRRDHLIGQYRRNDEIVMQVRYSF